MTNSLYIKLAKSNLKNNRQTYVPYMITAALTVMMYFLINNLALTKGINNDLAMMLNMGVGVIAVFSVIFLFYTNSFLMKRRQKEIGVYNILGMGKRHIAKMLIIETVIEAFISIASGLAVGILLSRLLHMVLKKIIQYDFIFKYSLSIKAIISTAVLFLIIFAVTLIYNLVQIKLSNSIELLHGGSVGEKEPKTRWLLTAAGVILLGIGYYIAITTKSPLAALSMFFVAVICVVLGTYALFIAGSVTFLKYLKKNKNFYYKTNHFTAVSGLLYRMKQNAVGLANICILSTAVIIMVSTTLSLYVGMNDLLASRFPHSFNVDIRNANQEDIDTVDGMIESAANENNIEISNDIYNKQVSVITKRDGADISTDKNSSANTFMSGYELTVFITQEEYNRFEDKNISLNDNQVLLFTVGDDYAKNKLTINNHRFEIKENLKSFKLDKKTDNAAVNGSYIIVKDFSVIQKTIGNDLAMESYSRAFDFKGDKDVVADVENNLENGLQEKFANISTDVKSTMVEGFYYLYGSLFFIGIYLGALFLMATVLIIYYKQISEGYDDKGRFEVMQKVGMSKKEVRASIKSQVLTVFFLPLVMAIIHVSVAFPVVTRLLAILNLKNTTLFLIATIICIIVFAVIYVIVYLITARQYYRIVN